MIAILWSVGCGVFTQPATYTECTLSPPIDDNLTTVRVDPDGVVWIHAVDRLHRYERAGGDDCALDGELWWDSDEFNAITDFELDAEGRPHLLVLFDRVVRLADDGSIDLECPVDAGHGLAVSPDGAEAWSISVGDETIYGVAMTEACAALDPVTAPDGMGTHPTWSNGSIAIDAHDATGTLPPGWVLDLDTAEFTIELGTDGYQDVEMFAMSDLVATDAGFLAAGSPDGDLWRLDADGVISSHEPLDDVLGGVDESMVNLYSIGLNPTGIDYVAAGFSTDRIYSVELD